MSSYKEVMDYLEEKITEEKKKRGRPRKNVADDVHIEVDKERFEEEKSRIYQYLSKLHAKEITPTYLISTLEDLGVIVETNMLPIKRVLADLKQLLEGK